MKQSEVSSGGKRAVTFPCLGLFVQTFPLLAA